MEEIAAAFSNVHLPSDFPGFTDFTTIYYQERRKSFDLGNQDSSQLNRRSLDNSWRLKFTVPPQVAKLSFVELTMQSKLRHPISAETDIETMNNLPGQYEYDSFSQVLEWVDPVRFDEFSLGQHRGYLKLREYYLRIGNSVGVRSMEKMIKNEVGIRRLAEDISGFRERFKGKIAKFHDGKFMGWWRGDETYDPAFAGMACYTIGESQNQDTDI